MNWIRTVGKSSHPTTLIEFPRLSMVVAPGCGSGVSLPAIYIYFYNGQSEPRPYSLESVIIPKCLKLFTPASSPACAAPRPLKSILSFKRSTNIRYGTDPGGTSLCYPRHRRANIIIVIRSVAFAVVGWGSKSACLWENFPVQ